MYGWYVHHTRTVGYRNGGYGSPGIDAGYPDLCLVKPATYRRDGTIKKPGQVFWVELKNEKGRLSDFQKKWLQALQDAEQEVYVWRPVDLPAALQRLSK